MEYLDTELVKLVNFIVGNKFRVIIFYDNEIRLGKIISDFDPSKI